MWEMGLQTTENYRLKIKFECSFTRVEYTFLAISIRNFKRFWLKVNIFWLKWMDLKSTISDVKTYNWPVNGTYPKDP
jgi:hypothetical protein